MSDVHPITRRIVDALAAGVDGAIEVSELVACANLVLKTPDAHVIGRELIALARRLSEAGLQRAAEQIVVLAGLALGDASASTIADVYPVKRDALESTTFRSTKAPVGSVAGGPLARVGAEAAIAQKSGVEKSDTPSAAKVTPKRKITI